MNGQRVLARDRVEEKRPEGQAGARRCRALYTGEMFGIYSKSNGKLVTLGSEMTRLMFSKDHFQKRYNHSSHTDIEMNRF